jgi:choline-glycine betaine transporter
MKIVSSTLLSFHPLSVNDILSLLLICSLSALMVKVREYCQKVRDIKNRVLVAALSHHFFSATHVLFCSVILIAVSCSQFCHYDTIGLEC